MYYQYTVKLTIKNNTDEKLEYTSSWFYAGRPERGETLQNIEAENCTTINMCAKDISDEETDGHTINYTNSTDKAFTFPRHHTADCSGYIVYNHATLQKVTIAFSNDNMTENKIGVGIGQNHDSQNVWKEMTYHYPVRTWNRKELIDHNSKESSIKERIDPNSREGIIDMGEYEITFHNTSGSENNAYVTFNKYSYNIIKKSATSAFVLKRDNTSEDAKEGKNKVMNKADLSIVTYAEHETDMKKESRYVNFSNENLSGIQKNKGNGINDNTNFIPSEDIREQDNYQVELNGNESFFTLTNSCSVI